MQKEVLEGRIIIKKVKGLENMADVLTKFLSKDEIRARLLGIGLEIVFKD